MDRREELALLPLDDEEAGRLLASVPSEKHKECWWIVLRDGTPVAGDKGGGVLLLASMQATGPLGRGLQRARLARVVDMLDTVLARCRKWGGRLVPDGPPPRRYP